MYKKKTVWNYSFVFTRFFRKRKLDTANNLQRQFIGQYKRGQISMRILIYGAGVIGSLYAALLAKAGYDTSIYARGKRLEILKNNGLLYKKDQDLIKAKFKEGIAGGPRVIPILHWDISVVTVLHL